MKTSTPSQHRSTFLTRAGLQRSAFTLVELIAVMAVVTTMAVLVGPSVSGLGRNQSMLKAVGDIAGTFQLARAHAMANNSYVYVGISQGESPASGQEAVYVSVVTTTDGTNGYETGTWQPTLTSLTKFQRFVGVNMVPMANVTTALPSMPASPNSADVAATTAATSYKPEDLGYRSGVVPVTKFSKVIQFNPAGGASVVETVSTSSTQLSRYVELGIAPVRGEQKNCAAIRIDGVTGSVRIYRP